VKVKNKLKDGKYAVIIIDKCEQIKKHNRTNTLFIFFKGLT